jgi:hypothetical protein
MGVLVSVEEACVVSDGAQPFKKLEEQAMSRQPRNNRFPGCAVKIMR